MQEQNPLVEKRIKQSNKRNTEKVKADVASFPPIPDKLYFSMGETSELCNVKPHVIRFWERAFPQFRPAKVSCGGRRYYGKAEIQLIRIIRDLLYKQGFTTDGARAQLEKAYSYISDTTNVNYHHHTKNANNAAKTLENEHYLTNHNNSSAAKTNNDCHRNNTKKEFLHYLLQNIEDILSLTESRLSLEKDTQTQTANVE